MIDTVTKTNLTDIKGVVADIERSSTHDGPGMRTVVFLKGCPLHCAWCHNPECISPEPETLFYPDKCIHCGGCKDGCYSGARVKCGRELTVSDVMREVRADKRYYGQLGGLTISGGEPLMQAEFTRALSLAAKSEGIGTGIETSLLIFDEPTLRTFDLIMFDLKLPDNKRHVEFTGVPASKIKENIARAAELGIPMLARTPVIPGVNADTETICEISDFLRGFPSIYKYELLPYHPLGLAKARAMGIEQRRFEQPSKQLMEELNQYAFIRTTT